ncbi:7-deoxyloganetin glucosyltransferase-like [Triticum urartu]|uniref:Glycosyltransferase n=1 Tax=Triticum urartu TaxID=4572 RepID=A0A8R7PBT8_TRIUA|nr:7-deoxyloganetin glucosyltransferase-like [Triticum urartu]XP_048543057.1 7-deoxyloganetin glucosyltransferase-like [Triticum urartu]XP_048560600.1 7-deoxyloganetin glucosyltransferase-like [Triticum urartu]
MDTAGPAGEKPHTVCLPFPTQGHITPMMKLAKLLHCKGFHITFVATEYNHRRLIRSRGPSAAAGLPGFAFATIPDGLPSSQADATQDPASLAYSTMTTCLPHLRNLLAGLNSTSGMPPVTCIVADNLMSFAVDAARELGVPAVLLWTASACGYMGYRNFRLLIDQGIIPLKDEEQLTNGFMDMPVDWAPGMSKHMRLKDFPTILRTTDRDDTALNFKLHHVERTEIADAVIINTMDELEQPALDAMRAIIPAIYTIGPLNSLTDQIVPFMDPLHKVSSSLWKEDHTCLQWLDGRKPRSVVYMNFGSVTVMSNHELVEFAWGLANSGQDFLWIIRPDIVKSEAAVLPPEFLEATKDRGLMASWCDQEAVLRHDAVCVFLTHCGWNSTVEGLCGGVPMLCWPFFAEQQTNGRYKCLEWGVGMEIGDNVRREVVMKRIKEAVGGEKGREMKKRAAEWREVAIRSKETSSNNLDSLINDVLLSGKKNS